MLEHSWKEKQKNKQTNEAFACGNVKRLMKRTDRRRRRRQRRFELLHFTSLIVHLTRYCAKSDIYPSATCLPSVNEGGRRKQCCLIRQVNVKENEHLSLTCGESLTSRIRRWRYWLSHIKTHTGASGRGGVARLLKLCLFFFSLPLFLVCFHSTVQLCLFCEPASHTL